MTEQLPLFFDSELDPIQTPEELAAELNVDVRTLEGWRYRRKGPEYIRLGKNGPVRYPRSLKLAWLADCATCPADDA